MNSTVMNTATVNAYWRFLKDLSDGVKLRLITLLSESITSKSVEEEMNTSNRTSRFIEEFCGAWKGDFSADELVDVIQKSRTSKNPISFK